MQETQETRVRPLGKEDPLEEEMATHSTDRGAPRATVHRLKILPVSFKESVTAEQLSTHKVNKISMKTNAMN